LVKYASCKLKGVQSKNRNALVIFWVYANLRIEKDEYLDEEFKRELEQKARQIAVKTGCKTEGEILEFVRIIVIFFENAASNNFEANLTEEYLRTLKK